MIQEMHSSEDTFGLVESQGKLGGQLSAGNLRVTLQDYTKATGISAGVLIDAVSGYFIKPVSCRLRQEFHDAIPGVETKRCERLVAAILDANSSGEAQVWTCPAGLADGLAPVMDNGKRVAWLVAGGVFLKKPDLRSSRAYARRKGFDPDRYAAVVEETKILSEDELRAHLDFLTGIVAGEIQSDVKPGDRLLDVAKDLEIFELVNDAVILLKGTEFYKANQKAVELFGTTQDMLLSSSPGKYSPQHQPSGRLSTEHARELIGLARQGEPQRYEWRYRRGDGTEFDADVSLSAVDLSSEQMVLCIVRDITGQKQLQQELEQSRELYRSMYKTASVGLFRTRISDGKFIKANQFTGMFRRQSPRWLVLW